VNSRNYRVLGLAENDPIPPLLTICAGTSSEGTEAELATTGDGLWHTLLDEQAALFRSLRFPRVLLTAS